MLKKLEKEGYIKKLPKSNKQVEESLNIARRDLISAQTMLNESNDWAYNIAYNAILQSMRALMYAQGYRASSKNSHIATLKFAEIYFTQPEIIFFDRMRRKRHQAVYDVAGTISQKEAEKAITRADKTIKKVEKMIFREKP